MSRANDGNEKVSNFIKTAIPLSETTMNFTKYILQTL